MIYYASKLLLLRLLFSLPSSIVGFMAIPVAFIDRDNAYRKSKINESLCISRIRKARIFYAWKESEMCTDAFSTEPQEALVTTNFAQNIHIYIHTYTYTDMRFTGRRGGSKSRRSKKKEKRGERRRARGAALFFFEHRKQEKKGHYQSADKEKKKINKQSSVTTARTIFLYRVLSGVVKS